MLVRAAYLGREGAPTETAAVVFYLPENWMPRRLLRRNRKHRDVWLPYRWYGLVWSQTNIDYELMGDDTIYDVVQGRDSHGAEATARNEAREWLLSDPGASVRDVAWSELPPFAQGMAARALRRGH